MKKIILNIVIIIFISILVEFISYYKIPAKKYLQKNSEVINLSDSMDFSGMDIMKGDIQSAKVIFTGENHKIDKDNDFKIKMIKYLQQEVNLKYLLEEIGYSDSYLINKYLESGDEAILQRVFENIKGTMAYNIDDYNTYKEIYKFNQILPKEKQIRSIGIDIEHTPLASYEYISDKIKNKKIVTKELDILLSNLSSNRKVFINIPEFYKRIENLKLDIKNNEEIYMEIFKEDFEGFKIVVENIDALCKTKMDDLNSTVIREEQIYKNFKIQDDKIQADKYYGQWGSFHTLQDAQIDIYSSDNYMQSFAGKLNKDLKYEGKVLTLYYSYYNTFDANFILKENLFKEAIKGKNDCILFKLNKNNSPFNKEIIWRENEYIRTKEGKGTLDYMQYIVILKNAITSKTITTENNKK